MVVSNAHVYRKVPIGSSHATKEEENKKITNQFMNYRELAES